MAVHVRLRQFDGPLDLLLTLIGKAKIDMKDIFVSQITEQYIQIVRDAPDFDMDEASEFIAMAALLVEIKSRALLPKPPKETEEDPEQALLERLAAYKQFKETARHMTELEKSARLVFGKLPEEYPLPPPTLEITGLTLTALWEALKRVQDRAPKQAEEPLFGFQDLQRESHSVEECIRVIEDRLKKGRLSFARLVGASQSKEEIITLFIALLEILKQGKAHVRQKDIFQDIVLLPGKKESHESE